MKRIIGTVFILCTINSIILQAMAQTRLITGKVIDVRSSKAVRGASITTDRGEGVGATDSIGVFHVRIPAQTKQLIFNHISFAEKRIDLRPQIGYYEVEIEPLDNRLDEAVVSTGYQKLPRERVTGSFELIDNELLNRSVSTDILSRIENVSSSVLFDRRNAGNPQISVRGVSTIESNASPLIVVDNFPYEGDIGNINPNDIENISILKDASASSIWGARAGNGVIVITTKRGKRQQPIKVAFNTSLTTGHRPDLFYDRRFLNAAEFIDVEKYLFSKEYYTWMETDLSAPPISPAVQLMIAGRDGKISAAEMASKIAELKTKDVRKDYEKYLFQRLLNQQYSLSLNGGNDNSSFYLNVGHDNNRASLVRNSLRRTSINSSVSYFPMKSLELSAQLVFTDHHETFNNAGPGAINSGGGRSIYPYAELASADGTALAVVRDYSTDFVSGTMQQGLLDWSYKPLDDLRNAVYTSKRSEVRINTAAKYSLNSSISFEGRYQYQSQNSLIRNLQGSMLYYSRNLQNQYSYMDEEGIRQFPVPKGAIMDNSTADLGAHSLRVQANFDRSWQRHQISAIGGYELRQARTDGISTRLYGYNDDKLTSVPVDYKSNFLVTPYYYNATVPNMDYLTGLLDRNSSFFANIAYTFNSRYTFSASARSDKSNLFGVKSNQKSVPLWSMGGSWQLSSEKFYPFADFLPQLRLRATYGFSGNVNKSLTAYATGIYSTDYTTGRPYLQLLTPPNPSLRWEKVRTVNFGIDFATTNKLVSGSIEFYSKLATDLIGKISIDPTIGHNVGGRNEFIGNSASLKAKGMDINLHVNKQLGAVMLSSQLLFSYNRDEITRYAYEQTSISGYFSPIPVPVEGNNRHALYSLRWAGLDVENGDPQIYVDGKVNKDYSKIMSSLGREDIRYNGSQLPPYFGSIRNSLTWRQLTVGFNISYKLGHFFRRSSVDYAALYNNWSGHVDFTDRWKEAGDELRTQVPSMAVPGTSSVRDYIYTYADVLVEKADHIRLQDINVRYDILKKKTTGSLFDRISLYGYINNVGLIWKSNNYGIDPDYANLGYPAVRTFSIGLNAQF